MALQDRPPVPKLKLQALALLKGFINAGVEGLTTAQLLNFTYQEEGRDGLFYVKHIGDWRSRKSELQKAGYVFEKYRVVGTDSFQYVLKGYNPDPQLSLIPAPTLQEARA